MTAPNRPRILVVGAGFCGPSIAKLLAADQQLEVVDAFAPGNGDMFYPYLEPPKNEPWYRQFDKRKKR